MSACRLFLFLVLTIVSVVVAQDETPQQETTAEKDTFNAKTHTDWGTYYDPKNVFCGQYDCYAILGFDYENFGQPTRKKITQRYRSLSREWHPDKNPRKDAKERFVKIARAYEVLTNEETRHEYDFMRYNQEAYFQKHGSSVLWEYAPKSDPITICILLLIVGSALSWFAQRQKWQNVADRLVAAAVEDLSPREGGTPEAKELRRKALAILAEQNGEDTNGSSPDSKKKKKQKLTSTEKKKQLHDQLRPIIAQMVEETHDDFGAGFHKPTWKDLLVVKLVKFPYVLGEGIVWNAGYMIRRLRKLPLTDEEREVLTIRAVGEIAWTSASEEEREQWKTRDLWKADNMMDWEEDQEIKLLSAGEQKRYARMKKKGKKIDWDKEE